MRNILKIIKLCQDHLKQKFKSEAHGIFTKKKLNLKND